MKIAANFSTVLINLIKENHNLPIDFIKVPTIPFQDCWHQFEQGEEFRPLIPHVAQIGIIALGHPDVTLQCNPQVVNQVMKWTGFPYLSTHLESRVSYFPELKEFQHHRNHNVYHALKKHFADTIQRIKAKIAVPLVLENFPYYRWWDHFRWGSEPEFIREICEETDCDFLLDVSHARCSAWHMGKDVFEYINGLPLDRLKEIHLAGSTMRGAEGLRDTHTALVKEDYHIYEYLLQKTKPAVITIEYGGMPEQILNIQQTYEPISRNEAKELQEIIFRVKELIDSKTYHSGN